MNSTEKQIAVCLVIVAFGGLVYFENGSSSEPHAPVSPETSGQTPVESIDPPDIIEPAPRDSRPTFHGYQCTQDCSGHEAGYKWAEEHDISDGDACDAAGGHSNSPSFAEGCHAYVDGDAAPEDQEKPEDDR
jgi:hypothetical protein